ncbi:MAG: hypothetical protein ACFFD1_07490 [Candidatus Thorarchaeota archaeon]
MQTTLTQDSDKLLIKDIREGYYECKKFFEKYTNEGYEIYTRQKKEFLKEIAKKFYEKHKEYVKKSITEEEVEERIRKEKTIPIKYNEGIFEYPESFVAYMDRIVDINVLSVKKIDMEEVERYMETVPKHYNFDQFCQGYYRRLQRVKVPLRRREIQLLGILTDHEFLKKTQEGKPRIQYPTIEEIMIGLRMDEKKKKAVERALNMLERYRIINPTKILFNPAPLGYELWLVDIPANLKEHTDVKTYLTAEIGCQTRIIYYGLPAQLQEAIGNKVYIPMTNWIWNVNIKAVGQGFRKQKVPNFMDDEQEKKGKRYNDWDLTKAIPRKLTPEQYEIVQELSSRGQLTQEIITGMEKKTDKETVKKTLEYLVENNVFQYYPEIES